MDGKAHVVVFCRDNQAGKPKPEAYREVSERKLGVERKKQAEKTTSWVFEERIKQKNPNRKLIKKFRNGNWVWRG